MFTQQHFFQRMSDMSYFLKLNKKFHLSGESRKGKSIVSHGKNVNEEFMGVNYIGIATSDAAEIFSVIPERFRPDFHLVLMNINSFIPPHIDNSITSTINFYIKPDECKTQFYEFKGDVKSKTNVYSLDELEAAESFFADDYSAYLLDVTKPHAVWDMGDDLINDQMRIMHTYEDAKADMVPDMSKKQADFPMGYKNTNRVAICLQSSKHCFDDVKKMLQETGYAEVA